MEHCWIYIWAFILGVIGICIAAPIIIALIIGGVYILFYIIVGIIVVTGGIISDIWNKIKTIFKKDKI